MKHLIIPDPHATPGTSNRRAEWVGKLVAEERPDVVVVLGDTADMPSLCSYDKGKKSFQGRTYQKDIDAHSDFQDRMFHSIRKAKRKMPRMVTLIGNHEERIARAIESQAELEGVISYDDLELNRNYDDVVHYEGATPGSIEIDGITYSHFLISGISGRPLGGEHHAYSILNKKYSSCVVGHSHMFDFCIKTRQNGDKIQALVAGVFQEHISSYAGDANKLWWRGGHVLNNVEDGRYDLKTISMAHLKKEYNK